MCGYYRGFCKNFASVVTPFTSLVSPSRQLDWAAGCQDSFDSAKALLCSMPVLTAPDFACLFEIEVDTSAYGAGTVLLQEDDHGIDHPVCFFSKKHQANYSTIEKEALASLLALQHLEVYVGSSSTPLLMYFDHNPLMFLSRMHKGNQCLMRWSLLLQDFNIEIHYIKRTDNIVTDALYCEGFFRCVCVWGGGVTMISHHLFLSV